MQVNVLYRPSQTVAQVWLQPNEALLAESGAMMGMSTNVNMQTQSGGILKGLKRMFGGESFFRNTFTAQGGQGEVLLTTPLCGDMVVLDCGAQQWQMANQAFVASSGTVDVATQASGKGFFSGAGLFILGTQGQGQCIVGSFGAIEPITVTGEMILDTGHLVAWDANLQYNITKASDSGWIASWLSGEGLVCRFQGQGQVFVQTRNAAEYGSTVGALLPARDGRSRRRTAMQAQVLHNPDFASIRVQFDQPGEQVVAEAGAMVARDTAMTMETNMRGGLGSALKRKLLGGESLFQNTFTATQPGQSLWIAPAPEGAIQEVDLQAGQEMFLQSGAYLASTTGVHLDTKWQGAKGFFSGEGLFLLRAHGQGKLWFCSYGGIHPVDIGQQYQGYICDTSHMVAFTQGLTYSINKVGGLKSLFFSGEGLVCTFQGQGRLWMQTRNPGALASFLHAFRPVRRSN